MWIIGLHRTYLKQDGSGKAEIIPNKKILGKSKGEAVRLSPVGKKLILAEGIETALSVYLATNIPTWATLSTSGLINTRPPPLEITQEIIIAADGDIAGKKAAYESADRLISQGYRVFIAQAPEGKDFNDLILEIKI